jgi:glycosyltransferase involved in cell wall biosynthesis
MKSVCLASHDGHDFLERQVRSILPQLSDSDELLIGDDASSDGTPDLVRSFGDPRIRLWEGRFGGAVANFEFLLSQARGSWILLSDQDDEWLPGRVDALEEAPPSALVVLCDAEVVDGQGRLLNPSLLAAYRARRGALCNLLHNGYSGCCMALRAELLPRILPFPKGIGMHDWWIGLAAERLGAAYWIRRPLVRHYRHGRNASFGLDKSRLSAWTRLAMRARLWWALSQRCG